MVKDKGVLFARASLNVAMMAWMEVATVKGDKDRPESLPRNICAAAIHDAEVGHFGLEIASTSDLACPDSPFTMHFLSWKSRCILNFAQLPCQAKWGEGKIVLHTRRMIVHPRLSQHHRTTTACFNQN